MLSHYYGNLGSDPEPTKTKGVYPTTPARLGSVPLGTGPETFENIVFLQFSSV